MFGMGGSEILVILIVALLFLGPDKLPEAAKQISKGIRDIKKQSRMLQQTIEDDEHIGGAIRDLKSALRGEDTPIRPRPIKPPGQLPAQIEAPPAPDPQLPGASAAAALVASTSSEGAERSGEASSDAHPVAPEALPADHGARAASPHDDADPAGLVKPAPNTIARGAALAASPDPSPNPPSPSLGPSLAEPNADR